MTETAPEIAIAPGSMVPNWRHVAPQLGFAGVLPVILYALLRPHLGSDAATLGVVTVFPLAEIAFERIRHGRLEPIGAIVLAGILVGLAGSVFMGGDPFLLKVRESLLTGLFGLACLASLLTRRPAMFYLARSFATGGDPGMLAAFDARWELPTVPLRFRISTTVWGVGLVAEAAARTVLAMVMPTQAFLVVAQVISYSVLAGLFWFAVLYSRASERQVAAIIKMGLPPEPPRPLKVAGGR